MYCIYVVYIYTCNTFTPKEFQRIHLPCIPLHRDTTTCTLVYIPGMWLHFKRANHFHPSKHSLDVDEV